MKHKKFVQVAKISPSRYYRNPSDVIRDRRLTNQDKLEILDIWEHEIRAQAIELPVAETGVDRVAEVQRLRRQLES